MQFYDFFRALILPLKEIDRSLPDEGKIIDLGCGEGVLASYLSQKKKRKVIGVDLDEKRLRKSRAKNLHFQKSDIRTYNLKNVSGVVLSDVLHHMNYEDQNRILANISRNLKSGGVLTIKEIDTNEIIRSKLSRIWDFIFYPNEKIYFSNSVTFLKKLEKLGFNISIKRASRLFPGSTTLFICRK